MSKISTKTSKSSKATTLKSVLLQSQLQQYLPLFQRNEIDFTTFLTLNEHSLKSIGIRNDSHRKVLLIYIRNLQQLLLPPPTAAIPIESNNNMSHSTFETVDDNESIKESSFIDSPNLDILTPITEEEEPCFQAVSEASNDVMDVTQANDGGTIKNKKSQVSAPIQDEHPTNEIQPNSTSSNEDEYTPVSLRSRKHYSTDNEDLLAIRRQRGAVVRNSTWRLSTPVTNNELPSYYDKLPSYYDIFDRQRIKEESHEDLPPYSCSVHKAGYIFKKTEFTSKGIRARDRSWKKQYLYLWGTFLRVYKSEPIDLNRVTPIHEFSMQDVKIGLANNYVKRNNVIRVQIPNGYQFIFQAQDHDHEHEECVAWIEKLQSSANISPILDEREMPMFITLPMRRRRVGISPTIPSLPSLSSSFSSVNSVNYEGGTRNDYGITILNYSSMPISSSGLTFQQFNDMARELQQVQITEALPQQQLSW